MNESEKRPPLLFDVTERILGQFFDVYNELGPGFQEFVYRRALVIALKQARMEVSEHAPVPVWFRGAPLVNFVADIVIPAGPVLIEVKATQAIEPFHIAQALGYLKATEIEVALLLNFGKRPQFKRLLFENSHKSALHGGGQPEEC